MLVATQQKLSPEYVRPQLSFVAPSEVSFEVWYQGAYITTVHSEDVANAYLNSGYSIMRIGASPNQLMF